ncbi:DUF58 domain-containing protein [Runella sp. CRIBMP]|jgi:uncharacterized protein (DUF58 family)|uniref:DUF58 domain-containing protein n=2 Tax=Runella TaxID=105 RepID=A0A369I4T5_9BACT|nr:MULTISPECIES: DUF58 domain-containing protein [Runella]MCP1382758.1 DUF58 domain-containing protein [Runella salmonicolor]NBB20817.1 DUF58 domain-containing protein [Runella sp. CRIBMP]RDB04801.1 DUF58 domain-containing protein [Runella aurantiaca]
MSTRTLDVARVRQYGNLEFLARQLVEGFITGLHKSPFHGFSVEFAEHRLYNTGESTRHIDWKVYGKTDRLFVKRYEEETNLRCHLLIDTSSSMYYPEPNHDKITFSAMAAASIANLLQRQKDAVSLCTFSDTIEIQTPIKSTPSHVHKIFLDLEGILQKPKEQRKTAVADVLHLIAEKIHKRSLVVIFSDMFEDINQTERIFSAMQHLRHNLHEVLLFHVTDRRTEEEFAFDDRPYEFIDLESGEKVKVQPGQVKKQYQEAVKKYYQELKLKCGQYKIDFIEADVAKGYDQILSAYLVKRNKMR